MIIPINSSLKDRVGSIFDRLFILKLKDIKKIIILPNYFKIFLRLSHAFRRLV